MCSVSVWDETGHIAAVWPSEDRWDPGVDYMDVELTEKADPTD